MPMPLAIKVNAPYFTYKTILEQSGNLPEFSQKEKTQWNSDEQINGYEILSRRRNRRK